MRGGRIWRAHRSGGPDKHKFSKVSSTSMVGLHGEYTREVTFEHLCQRDEVGNGGTTSPSRVGQLSGGFGSQLMSKDKERNIQKTRIEKLKLRITQLERRLHGTSSPKLNPTQITTN